MSQDKISYHDICSEIRKRLNLKNGQVDLYQFKAIFAEFENDNCASLVIRIEKPIGNKKINRKPKELTCIDIAKRFNITSRTLLYWIYSDALKIGKKLNKKRASYIWNDAALEKIKLILNFRKYGYILREIKIFMEYLELKNYKYSNGKRYLVLDTKNNPIALLESKPEVIESNKKFISLSL